ncbi:ABC transporter substrate-binding protein [Leucobacter sp. wl10]|uniref:ABC transporter substrate-binding protein n=1 Tax=Leucobacter sp. wl10 TaxID=2304677 RepID=UPI000E5BF1EA|nr:extracellular solute-binding protein [Leucobacter sp. wl10]RGE21879.1 extracellular solute-binding protein [Leucobacter sp. wl10]
MNTRVRRLAVVSGLAAAAVLITGCASSPASGGAATSGGVDWSTVTSAEEGGGMDALIKAAQAEGTLNTMGLYEDWANYGGLLQAFSEKYGIEIVNDTSMGSSQDLINAVKNRVGQDTSLDYLDTGVSFAEGAAKEGLLAEYTPQTIDDIPAEKRSASNQWINHLGGSIAIGCDTSRIKDCPTSFAELLEPQYKNSIAIPGDPTQGESSFMTVYAAALATGGSLDDIGPGIDYFQQLSKSGNLLQVEHSLGTIETGETPIVLNWDYLMLPQAAQLKKSGIDFTIALPEDGTVSSFYAASINADAPNPAVARLFYEFLFSDEGQNLLLEGFVSPVRLPAMTEAGTADEALVAALPKGSGEDPLPSIQQRDAAQAVVSERWMSAVAGQ